MPSGRKGQGEGTFGYTDAVRVIADLHLHSRFSRATSAEMDLPHLAKWARWKGLDLLGTGDFTHPQWFEELTAGLVPVGEGIYEHAGVPFVFTAEVALIWTHEDRTRRVHFLVLAPSAADAGRINRELGKRCDLEADGRPTVGMSGADFIALVLTASPKAVVIPAHAWTPWYSIFGSQSGFDSLEEALGEAARHVFAIETGLSSDPPMNWRVSSLDRVTLVSFSDAHSPSRLGREACVFDLPELTFSALVQAIRDRDPQRFLFTLEFFPEEGKYHYDGHRACGVVFSPEQTRKAGRRCPVCGRLVTVGVMYRVERLADRPPGFRPPAAIPCRHLVPLHEIVAQLLGQGVETKAVEEEYFRLVHRFGSEMNVLLDVPVQEVGQVSPRLARALAKVRAREVRVQPGFDGQYGRIEIPLDEEVRGPTLFDV